MSTWMRLLAFMGGAKVAMTLPTAPVLSNDPNDPQPETNGHMLWTQSTDKQAQTTSSAMMSNRSREDAAAEFLRWMQEREDKPKHIVHKKRSAANETVENVIKKAGMRAKALLASHASRSKRSRKVVLRKTASRRHHSLQNSVAKNHHHELMPEARELCRDQELNKWGQRRMMQDLFTIWKKRFPESSVFSHEQMALPGCLIQGVTHLSKSATSRSAFPIMPTHTSHVLSLVWGGADTLCNDYHKPWHKFEPWMFKVGEPLSVRGEERLVATVWPRSRHCSGGRGCPMVVFLSGVGEHSDALLSPAVHNDTTIFRTYFEKVRKWGLLRYAENDKNCMGSLGSILLAPELDRKETWVTHGQELMTHFILPLLAFTKSQNHKLVDSKRVSLVGYSEGAFGALQGAVQYPEVFTVVVAASASTSEQWWRQIPMPAKRQTMNAHSIKLRTVIVALGEWDDVGVDLPGNFQRTLDWLSMYGVTKVASLAVQVYAKLPHQGVWDYVYNRWPAFHEVIWRGNYNFHLK